MASTLTLSVRSVAMAIAVPPCDFTASTASDMSDSIGTRNGNGCPGFGQRGCQEGRPAPPVCSDDRLSSG